MVPFIDPQGNFGSLDDPPAAARYTECRLADVGDGHGAANSTRTRSTSGPPTTGRARSRWCCPAALPSIIVNGTSGIAVGMATNMAPHNLREVEKAITDRDEEAAAEADRRRADEGPARSRLPVTGGIVVDDGLREAYETGRGSVPHPGQGPCGAGHPGPAGDRGHRTAVPRRSRAGGRQGPGAGQQRQGGGRSRGSPISPT